MLDSIDLKILNILQEDGRIKRNLIAEKVGLSLPSLSDRLNKLEEHGIIEGYFAKLNRKVFEFDIMAFVVVVTDSSKNYDLLVESIKNNPEILECHSILGEGSHLLKAIVKDTQALEVLLRNLQSLPGVTRTVTNFVLSTIKETTKIHIQ